MNPIGTVLTWRERRLTDEQIPDTEQEVCREEGDSVEGEGLQAASAARQVEDPDHHAA